MTQISFQAAFDPLHAMFRLLRMRAAVPSSPISLDHLRILDFYLTFPYRLSEVRVKPEHRWIKTIAKQYVDAVPYGEAPDDRALFNRMQPFQLAGLETLVRLGIYTQREPQSREYSQNPEASIPEELCARVVAKNAAESDLLKALSTFASEYSLYGVNGLKDRSKLMEHRHDSV